MFRIGISIAFFLSFAICFYLGVYALTLNARALRNRVFLMLCLSFSIWALAFSVMNWTADMETAQLWRRISAFGWGISYSFALHLSMILVGKDKMLSKKWFYIVLYLPSLIIFYVYGFNNELSSLQSYIELTPNGWATISNNTFWEYFFKAYYIVYSFFAVYIIGRYGRSSEAYVDKKSSTLIAVGYIFSVLLGTVTDAVANNIFDVKIPSMAPIFILLPIAAFFYAIQWRGLMTPENNSSIMDDNLILSEKSRFVFIRYVSVIIFFCSYIVYMHVFVEKASVTYILLLSAALVVLASVIMLMRVLNADAELYEAIVTFIMAMVMVVVMVVFYSLNLGNIVWPIPIFFLIASILISNRKSLWIIYLTSLIIGIALADVNTVKRLEVNDVDSIVRLSFVVFGVVLSYFVNRIYIQRLKEIENQAGFQNMISLISRRFAGAKGDKVEDIVFDVLKILAEKYGVNNAYLLVKKENGDNSFFTYSYILKDEKEGASVRCTSCGYSSESLMHNLMIGIDGGESLLVPINSNERMKGFLALEGALKGTVFTPIVSNQLVIVGNLVLSTLEYVEDQLEVNNLAYFDSLTGLPNRIRFSEIFGEEIDKAGLEGRALGLILIDLDGFKELNDTMGHELGDIVLKKVANNLSKLADKDAVARFGGDEFLIFIKSEVCESEHGIDSILEKIVELFSKPIAVNEQEFFLTASAGIAMYPKDGYTVEALIKNADAAMYVAKSNGKNQCCICNEQIKDEIIDKMKMTNNLYRALENNELYMVYQPQIEFETGKIVGFEALMRWRSPIFGNVSPMVFIPIAERTGLIAQFGIWALKEACSTAVKWHKEYGRLYRMAVNISIKQFYAGDLIENIINVLKETGLPPEKLDIEITESMIMKNPEYIIDELRKFSEIGVEVSIDDFGMEYSSLERLKSLPIDRLKIDMSFVRALTDEESDISIVESIIYLAKRLGMEVLAEGVETKLQHDLLKAKKCDEYQGYYSYKPLSVLEINTMLKEMEK